MRTLGRTAVLITIALVTAIAFAACGAGDDDDDEEPQIQSAHGDSVRSAVLSAADRIGAAAEDEDSRGGSAQPGFAQAPDLNVGPASALQQGTPGITVTGYGVATIEADSAFLELYFGGYYVEVPADDRDAVPGSGGVSYRSVSAISEADLQPVIDALIEAGVAREDIELLGGTYYDPYSSSATLRVTVRDLDRIGDLVDAAADGAGELQEIYLQGTYVSYTVEDCGALAQAALDEAVADARERGAALAQSLGVTLGEVNAAADYGWSPFGGTPCGVDYAVPVPMGGVAYAESQAPQVDFYATISVTFAIG